MYAAIEEDVDPWAAADYGTILSEDSPAEEAKHVRVLCLHGGGENRLAMEYRMAALMSQLGEHAVFDYLEGPLHWTGHIDADIATMFGAGGYWAWYTLAASGVCDGISQSLFHIESYIKDHGPFDVLVGFSQGCSIITLLVARLLKSGLRPGAQTGPKLDSVGVPWRLLILCNGVPPPDTDEYRQCFTHLLDVPTLHVMGKADRFYAASLRLRGLYSCPHVIEHNEGHKLPRDSNLHAQIASVVKDYLPQKMRAASFSSSDS